MKVEKLLEIIDSDFYTGVPDSQLKALCDYLMQHYGIDSKRHLIAANEGNCTAIAAGYHLATGKVPVVYMQNSGEGNIINPVTSLLNDKVYAIPCVFIIGWRGEPGIHDEPQHIYQGEITVKLLNDLDIQAFVVGKETTDEEVIDAMNTFRVALETGKSVAFVIRKGALSYDGKVVYKNENRMLREDIIKHITKVTDHDPVISTTGKASRELYEIRESAGQGHQYDFLTVGSMGHSSSIALGIAVNKPETKIWCIDGDGAALMHMGAMPFIASQGLENFYHIVINNMAHESVGAMPTGCQQTSFADIAGAAGYRVVDKFKTLGEVDQIGKRILEEKGPVLFEIPVALGARADLGRPKESAKENKETFMEFLKKCQ